MQHEDLVKLAVDTSLSEATNGTSTTKHEDLVRLAVDTSIEVLARRGIQGFCKIISSGWTDTATFHAVTIVYMREKDSFIIDLYGTEEILKEVNTSIREAIRAGC
jgi:hypothetical protein